MKELPPKEPKIISFKVPSGLIFEMPEVKEMMRQNKEPIYREPIDDGKYDSSGNKL